jgi:hypothetical protein
MHEPSISSFSCPDHPQISTKKHREFMDFWLLIRDSGDQTSDQLSRNPGRFRFERALDETTGFERLHPGGACVSAAVR